MDAIERHKIESVDLIESFTLMHNSAVLILIG